MIMTMYYLLLRCNDLLWNMYYEMNVFTGYKQGVSMNNELVYVKLVEVNFFEIIHQ
jgi:hypothetical protein